MRINRSLIGTGCIAIILAITAGCGQDNADRTSGAAVTAQPGATTIATSSPAPTATTRPAVQATQQPAAKSVSILPAVPDYYESGRGYDIAGVSREAFYSVDQELPLGLFLPETMIRFEQGGRTAWGTPDKLNYITLIKTGEADKTADNQNFTLADEPQLLKYKEYLGYRMDGEARTDAFEFVAKDQLYRAELHISPEQREVLLPVFVAMLGDIEYMKKQPPITPGVFFTAPDVGNDHGKQQALQEIITCLEAWAAGDKEKFAATMYSELLNDGLQFLFDNKNVYHFKELEVRGIPMEGAKRAAFIVSYQRMTPEGYILDGSNEISLLKNKQGEWKIASID